MTCSVCQHRAAWVWNPPGATVLFLCDDDAAGKDPGELEEL